MTTLPAPPTSKRQLPTGHYKFRHALGSEWIKFRTVRSTMWCLGTFSLIMIGFSALFCAVTVSQWGKRPEEALTFDPVTASLAGVTMGSLAIGVLGVLVVSSEYGTGSIKATFAAIPHRTTVLLAKAVVLSISVFIVAAISELIAFFLGQTILRSASGSQPIVINGVHLPAKPPTVTLSGPGVMTALVATALFLTLLSLLTLGLGFLIRHTAGAISAFVGLLFPLFLLVVLLPATFKDRLEKFLPLQIQQTVVASKPIVSATSLSIWAGVLAMAVYAVVALAIGAVLLTRRDA